MIISTRLQVLACLIVYISCASAITVKYGTNDGPIEPPTTPQPPAPPPKPYHDPAPVWEERSNDTPDPNAQWRPQLFVPQPRYTQVIYNPQQPTYSKAKQFVNAYIPQNRQPIQVQPTKDYFTPAQILSSQNLPGIGIRYFAPVNVYRQRQKIVQEDGKLNAIETNEINHKQETTSDLQWKLEKEAATRVTRNSQESFVRPYVYQWPTYVHRQQ